MNELQPDGTPDCNRASDVGKSLLETAGNFQSHQ